MSCTRFQWVAVVNSTILMLLLSGSACADPPEPVLRTFGVFVNDPDLLDFESEDSVAVTVLPQATHRSNLFHIRFLSSGTGDYANYPPPYNEVDDERLDGTTWFLYPAMHTVKGANGGDHLIFWLDEVDDPPLQFDPPPIGSHTFTGPDGLIVSQIKRYVGYSSSGDWWVLPPPSGLPGTYFVVVTAWFSQ